jgi:UDP-perosamine 4-acetyltransferase
MKEKVIVVGDGGHAKVVIDILKEIGDYEIIGVTSKDKDKDEFFGIPVLGNDEILEFYKDKGIKSIALGIGGFRDNQLRTQLFNMFTERGFNIINAIHPKAIISKTARIGTGVVIFAGVILNPEVKIGSNVIIATGATIDHVTAIKDHCLISAGVTVGANVRIGEGTLCALGSKIISGINIGSNSLIAAGAVVVKDVTNNSQVFGIPAKEKGI